MGRMEPSWAQINICSFLGALISFQKGCSCSRPRFSIAFECRVCQSQHWFVGDKCHGGEWASFLPLGPLRKAFIHRDLYMFLYTFKLCLLCVFSIFGFLLVFISLLKILLLYRIPSEGCAWMLSCSSSVFSICKCSYIFNKNSATARWCTWQLSLYLSASFSHPLGSQRLSSPTPDHLSAVSAWGIQRLRETLLSQAVRKLYQNGMFCILYFTLIFLNIKVTEAWLSYGTCILI